MKNILLKTKPVLTAKGTIEIDAWVKEKGIEMEWIYVGLYLSVPEAIKKASEIEENNLI